MIRAVRGPHWQPKKSGPAATVTFIRGVVLAILMLGLVGTVAELLLLEHTEGFWQLLPVYLIALSLVVVGWHTADRRAASTRVLQATMILFVITGIAGLVLHYRGNVEFELELHPTAGGLGLFWEAMKGATPALAPATMTQLGLLGLAYTYRHPALVGSTEDGVGSSKIGGMR